MTFIHVQEKISAQPETIWKAIEDVRTHVTWMTDAREIRITSEQVEGVGLTFDCITQVGPLRTTDRMQVTEWVPNHIMGIMHKGLFTGEGKFTLEKSGEGETVFIWEENLNFPFWLGGEITGFMAKPILRHIWKKNIYRLKEKIEGL